MVPAGGVEVLVAGGSVAEWVIVGKARDLEALVERHLEAAAVARRSRSWLLGPLRVRRVVGLMFARRGLVHIETIVANIDGWNAGVEVEVDDLVDFAEDIAMVLAVEGILAAVVNSMMLQVVVHHMRRLACRMKGTVLEAVGSRRTAPVVVEKHSHPWVAHYRCNSSPRLQDHLARRRVY